MPRTVLVQFDQLHREHGALRAAVPGRDRILLVESERMTTGRRWHVQRLWFIISAARHFAAALEAEGFEVDYRKSATTVAGIREHLAEFGEREVVTAEASSRRLRANLEAAGVNFVPNDFFLTSRDEFQAWASSQKTLVMENFYRRQRVRLGILVADGKPTGGSWNFDADNRLPPPKGHVYPQPLSFEPDEIDRQVLAEIEGRRKAHPEDYWGDGPSGVWGTTRAAALAQLDDFLSNRFENFGPYEDAMPRDSWSVYHSLLSPYMNVGLLHASEVMEAVRVRFQQGGVSLASCEGFVRQVIGWREYINGIYWFFNDRYRESNALAANRKLLPLYWNPQTTEMNCARSVVEDLHERSWVHHIPRLMVLSNLALLTAVNPQEYLDWMRQTFIDASEWVMVPNVIGMGVHADNGQMMTKPYAAGGAYVNRMSNYCGGCRFDPKKRTGEDACPLTTLYWDFLDRNREGFARNHRIAQQVKGLDRLSDLPEVRARAREVLAKLEAGEL